MKIRISDVLVYFACISTFMNALSGIPDINIVEQTPVLDHISNEIDAHHERITGYEELLSVATQFSDEIDYKLIESLVGSQFSVAYKRDKKSSIGSEFFAYPRAQKQEFGFDGYNSVIAGNSFQLSPSGAGAADIIYSTDSLSELNLSKLVGLNLLSLPISTPTLLLIRKSDNLKSLQLPYFSEPLLRDDTLELPKNIEWLIIYNAFLDERILEKIVDLPDLKRLTLDTCTVPLLKPEKLNEALNKITEIEIYRSSGELLDFALSIPLPNLTELSVYHQQSYEILKENRVLDGDFEAL